MMKTQNMKYIYVAHPLRGAGITTETVRENIRAVSRICLDIKEKHPDVLILSPIHAYTFEPIDADDKWVLGQCRELLTLADEIWVFGDWKTSKGCRMEIDFAYKNSIPIYIDGILTIDNPMHQEE